MKTKVVNRSGFNCDFKNLFTAPVGTLVPVLSDELMPNTNVDLRVKLQASLPPLASDTFMRCDIRLEAFFVPYRILYGGWQHWFTQQPLLVPATSSKAVPVLPYIACDPPASAADDPDWKPYLEAGSLGDYLGFKIANFEFGTIVPVHTRTFKLNIFPFLAYHKIYDDWYRNKLIQTPIFAPRFSSPTAAQYYSLANLPYVTSDNTTYLKKVLDNTFDDGVHLGDLRQRNYGDDYFTSALNSPQLGAAQGLTLSVSGGSTSFSIADLRAANSMQQMLEKEQLGGYDYVLQNKVKYGADLSNGMANRPLYLGSMRCTIYNRGVDANANTPDVSSRNPFNGSVAAQYGSAIAVADDQLVRDFHCDEYGILMVNCSLVPKVTYATGIKRQLHHFSGNYGSQTSTKMDLPDPTLQNLGPQPIYATELLAGADGLNVGYDSVFGYSDRYAEFCTCEDELHGLMRVGESLDSFAPQRSIGSVAYINSSFLEIPKTALDIVSAASADISDYGYWCDMDFRYRKLQPLQQYCIPSLQDPAYEHGHDVNISRGGQSIK